MYTKRTLRTKPLYPDITKDKIFSRKNIKNPFQKIAGSLAHQTFYVKPVYNNLMGRNHFSQQGGPYFINNGFSKHDHNHKPGGSHEDIKPDKTIFYSIMIGFVVILVTIGFVLNSLS